MLWLWFALIAAITTAAYRVTTRHVMKQHSPWAYALLINVFGAAYTIPFFLADWSQGVPTDWWPWALVLASTALWSTIMVLAFTSMKLVPVSRREQISQVEVLFILLFGIIFLRESFTWAKGLGAVLVIGGALVAATGRTAMHGGWRSKGVILTVIVASLYALVAIVDKAALQYFPTGTYTFLLYLLPMLVLSVGLWQKRAWRDTHVLLSEKGMVVAGATALSVTSYYFGLRAYDLADASVVYTILKLSVVFAVLGGILFFPEERVHIPRKLIAAALVVLGAIVIAGGAYLNVIGFF